SLPAGPIVTSVVEIVAVENIVKLALFSHCLKFRIQLLLAEVTAICRIRHVVAVLHLFRGNKLVPKSVARDEFNDDIPLVRWVARTFSSDGERPRAKLLMCN